MISCARCVYHVILIQLHHPLIARGLSYPMSPSGTFDSFAACAHAANEIVLILIAYDQTFSIRKAPYLVAYATYVSATIHVRCAAQRSPATESLASLRTCIDLLDLNQKTNPGVRNAKASLKNLSDSLNVVYPDEPTRQPSSAQLPLTRHSSITESSSNLPSMRSPSTDLHFGEQTPSVEIRRDTGSRNSGFETDAYLENFSESQIGTGHLSGSMNYQGLFTQFQPGAGLQQQVDPSSSNAFEGSLLDPIGMNVARGSFGFGEQSELYAGLDRYGGPMQYSGSIGDFGS